MPDEDLKELLRVTQLTPSSFNMQNYRILVVRDKELRAKLRAVAWDQAQVTDASVLLIFCGDKTAYAEDPGKFWGHAPQEVQDILGPMIKPFYEGKDELIRDEAIRSSAFAGMSMMLAARDLGYDSCPMIGFDAQEVAKLINLPDGFVLSYMLPVGKKIQDAWDRGARIGEETVVSYDTF